MENLTLNNYKGKQLDYLSFSELDYVFFAIVLGISTGIGVYFGFFKRQNTTKDYLLGGKNMGVFPVAVSLAASYTSAITLLGMPAEIYSYGTQYATSCLTAFLTTFVTRFVFLPVFYDLHLDSSFEYLSLRFNKKVRMTASFLCLVGYIMNIPLVMYVPALAFKLVSGISIMYTTLVVCIICIFYTTIGGLKAVVWTDTVQFIIMNIGIFTILFLGIPHEGGLQRIWQTAEEADRIHFIDLDPSFYKRTTLWSMTIGMCVTWIASMGVNQMCIQRFLSVPTLADATKVMYIYCGFVVVMKAFCLFSGLIMFARYSGCDPLAAGIITSADQILPYYVMDTARNVPGLPGLFVAGVFSAALSTMSTILNTACGMIYKDFLINVLPVDIKEEAASRIMKFIVVLIGVLCMFMVLWMEKLGNILELSISFDGMASGAMLGTFTIGMLIPRANTKGTVAGALTSLVLMCWILYGTKSAESRGAIRYPKKPFSVDECYPPINSTVLCDPSEEVEDIFFLFKISFMWYSMIGILTTVVVAVPISYLTKPPSLEQVRLEYFSPVVKKFLPEYIKNNRIPRIDRKFEYDRVKSGL